jgi:hypothetical protein
VGSTSCAYERRLFCKRCDVPQARDPVVDQTCNEGNCADEDCDGEKAAYEAALKKRIRLLLRLNRTFVKGWTQAALKAAQTVPFRATASIPD